MAGNITLSWLDLRNSAQSSELAKFFAENYKLTLFNRTQLSLDTLPRCGADIICFEYDYPDIPSLNLLQEARKIFPDSPIIMFTEQHSEALAVWAFRTGVWDYFVLPLPEGGTAEIAASLNNANSFCFSLRQQFQLAENVRLPDEVRFRAPTGNEKLLLPAINYIEIHYGAKVSEEHLAELCQMTCSQFSRLFRSTYDITFQEYLVRYRIGESARLLLNPVASIADIAYSVGFKDPSYYARAFKKHLGVTPSGFRAMLKDRDEGELVDELFRKIA